MKQFLLMMLFALSMASSYAKDKKPKIDVNEDTVTVDKVNVFILEKIKANAGTRNFYLKDLQGKKLALIQSDCYEDPTSPNPNRYKYTSAPAYLNSCYYSITFIGSKKTSDFSFYQKESRLAEFLMESGLVKNGTIAQEDEDEFILIHGNKNAEEKSQKLGGNTIIINNNNTTPAQGNGVHFNIGN